MVGLTSSDTLLFLLLKQLLWS